MILSALVVSALVDRQSRNAPIPTIDWNNLPYQNQVKQMADGWREKYHLPGVWVALIKDGKVVACVATGVKNIETGTPALVSDYLNVGSVSKVITGMMIAQFVAKGVISYDTTVGEAFPELAEKFPESQFSRVTLAQLLTHTSGLPRTIRPGQNEWDGGGPSWRYEITKNSFADAHSNEFGHSFQSYPATNSEEFGHVQ